MRGGAYMGLDCRREVAGPSNNLTISEGAWRGARIKLKEGWHMGKFKKRTTLFWFSFWGRGNSTMSRNHHHISTHSLTPSINPLPPTFRRATSKGAVFFFPFFEWRGLNDFYRGMITLACDVSYYLRDSNQHKIIHPLAPGGSTRTSPWRRIQKI